MSLCLHQFMAGQAQLHTAHGMDDQKQESLEL